MKDLLQSLWGHVKPRQRRELYLLFLLMLGVSLMEMISIGAVFPFLVALTTPEKMYVHPIGQFISKLLILKEPKDLLVPVTIFFILAILIAGCVRLLLVWVQTKLSYAIGADLALEVYRRTLFQPYVVHTKRSSSEIINAVYAKASGISSYVILPLVTISSAVILIGAIILALLSVEPGISLVAFAGFGIIYTLVAKLTHRRLHSNSRLVADEAGNVIRTLQEGLGGIRDVLLDHSQDIYCNTFRRADISMRTAQINSAFIAQSPRYIIEALGMLLIAIMALQLARTNEGIVTYIPVLGALALGAQRILPILQQCFQAWTSIRSNQASLADTVDLLSQPIPDYLSTELLKPVPFNSTLEIENLWFRYASESDWILKGISITIHKGTKLGFIGVTGCGKSTLLDVVMGLLPPSCGQILIDGNQLQDHDIPGWQRRIAHVPQAVFIADSNIACNIAFGVPENEIDIARLTDSARRAQLLETIESWPEGFSTQVGERGARLSGGQRQRIGLARALYKNADVLVFDEATSALDNETEQAVMDSVQSLGSEITVLIVAHRLNTLSKCDTIIELDNGKVSRIGSYQEIIGSL